MSLQNVLDSRSHGLVPIASIARMFNVPTPNADALIRIGSTINKIDFWKEGLTCEKLGIAGLSLEKLEQFLERGFSYKHD
jgi:opine dehydrogenase